MPQINQQVEKQYTEWVYPKPIADLDEWAKNHCLMCDPAHHASLFWPVGKPKAPYKMLVVGCGTSQAAILAYTNPEAQVVGIDISQPSLDCAAALKAKHNLANLELRKLDLFDVAQLAMSFDVIYATGVLHHLPDPASGLKALSHVLADDGVMCVMLYAHYGRAGLERLQEAMLLLDVGQNTAGIHQARQILTTVPRWHPAQPYLRGAAGDLADDACLVDTLLHAQERSFTVPQILEFVRAGGMHFQGWTDNLDYYPDAAVPPEHPSFQAMAALPHEQQWIASELLYQHSGVHSFLLRKQDAQNLRPDFGGVDFMRWIPARRYLLDVTDKEDVVILEREGNACGLGGVQRDLFLAVDGQKSCGDLITSLAPQEPVATLARAFFERMWKLGHLTYHRAAA